MGSEGLPVLMYHSIADDATPAFRDFVVPPETFRAQLRVLAESGWTGVSMAQAAALRHGGARLPERTVVLTFDDGFKDFVDAALPMLDHHGFSATLYVATGFVGSTSAWLAPEGEAGRSMLHWRDLREVAAGGIEVGAHSHTHPQLDLVSNGAALARELLMPKELLEDQIGVPVTTLAYPFGYANRRVRDLAQEVGYVSACTVDDLVGSTDPMRVPRLTVTRETDMTEVVGVLGEPSRLGARAEAAVRRFASARLRRLGLKKRESAKQSRALR